jgi:hypothetical protein
MRTWLGAALAALLLAGTASAADEGAQEKIRRFTVKAQQLEAADDQKRFVEEVGTLRAWLNEAQAFAAQDEAESTNRALERVAVQVRLLEALLDRAHAEDAARQAHERADAVEKDLAEARDKAADLERRQSELEKAGL